MSTQEQNHKAARIEIEEPDGFALKQLTEEDDQRYLDLVESSRAHLSQFGDDTSEKYPDLESVHKRREEAERLGIYRFGIWTGNEMVGTINLSPDAGGSTGEVGYWVGEQYTGHGYAGKATQALVKYAFEQLTPELLYAEVAIGNIASRKTLEKSGFRFVDQGKSHWYFEINKPAISTA